MPWIRKSDAEVLPTEKKAKERRDTILEAIQVLSLDLAEVKGELAATSSQRRLQNELNKLKEQISDARIEKSRMDEEHARERREIEHHVGLERQRVDLEIENAKTQAALTAREENLQGKEDLFDQHMKFYKEQMDAHIDDVKNLLNQVMTRIPTVNVDRRIRENYGELLTGDDDD